MSPHYWISAVGIAEANSSRRVRRQRIKFAAWMCGKIFARYGMLPVYMIPPFALFLILQSVPDLKGWADLGGFALFAAYMVYRHEKVGTAHAEKITELLRDGHARESRLIDALESNAQSHGQLLGGIEALTKAVDKIGNI